MKMNIYLKRSMVFPIGRYMKEKKYDLPDFVRADLDCEHNCNMTDPK